MLAGMKDTMSFFANFWAFWLLLVLPALGLIALRARRQVQRALSRLGNPGAVRLLTLVLPGAVAQQWLCVFVGTLLLIVSICGPQLGRDYRQSGRASGTDLVVALDLSRTMLAEKPSRQERARRALNDLCAGLAESGGHRVALVIFAAQAELVFPLTHDVNHLRTMLRELDADALPAKFRADAGAGVISGTRIGRGLQVAVAQLPPDDANTKRDIILISDGDDPAADGEWKLGIDAAVARRIPVHAVSVGDPTADSTIPFEGEPLQHQGRIVKTKVNEAPLEQIARATGGVFLPGRTSAIPLGKFFREVVEPRGQQRVINDATSDEEFTYRQRYAWFLAPALGFLTFAMLIRERRASQRAPIKRVLSPASAAVAAVALLGLAAESLPSGAELIGLANAAFADGKLEQAAALYDRAALITSDPGLVAFNKGTTLYRLRRYAEAEAHYRRCLEDQEASSERKARCLYDLGNCLVQQGKSPQQLHDAIACYRGCLQLADAGSKLQADAAHNLGAAKMIWLKLPPTQQQPPVGKDPNDKSEEKDPKSPMDDPAVEKKNGDKKSGEVKEGATDAEKTVQKMAAGGQLFNLPDDEQLTPLSHSNTRDLLEREMRRMLQGRRDMRQANRPIAADVKDW